MDLSVRPQELRALATGLEETRARLSRVKGEAGSAAHDLGHARLQEEVRRFGAAWAEGLEEIEQHLLGRVQGLRVAAEAYAAVDAGLADACDGARAP